jgi:hypothetical protein
MALGIEAPPVAAMEEAMDDGSRKTAKAEAETAPAKASKKKGGKITTKAKAPKEPKPKQEKVENPVVFAFRLSEADRTKIHEAAGSGKATRFVRTAALAAANGDTKAFEELAAQAKANLK